MCGVYLNPTAGSFQIDVPSNIPVTAVSATDVLGKVQNLRFSPVSTGKLQVSESLLPGFYQILLRDQSGDLYRAVLMVK